MRKLLIIGLIMLVSGIVFSNLSAQEKTSSEEDINKLIQKLGDDDWKVRKEANRQLEKMLLARKDMASQLEKAFKEAKDHEVKIRLQYLQKLLRSFTSWGITSSLLEKFPDVLSKLESEDVEVRSQIAKELGDKKLKDAVQPLIKLLTYRQRTHGCKHCAPSIKDRISARDALIKIGKPAVEPLVEALNTCNARTHTTDALIEIGEPAVEPLAKVLKNENAKVRYSAARALEKIGDRRIVEPLIEALKDEDKWVRRHVVRTLVRITDEKAVKPLRKLWREEKDEYVKVNVAYGLAKIAGDDDAFKFLIKVLKDEDWHIRSDAAGALGEIGDERAIVPLIKALEDRSWRFHSSAARALGKIGDTRAVGPLIKALKDDRNVRYCAAWALGEIGDKIAVKPLIEALKVLDYSVCCSAAKALAKIGDTRAVRPLIRLLKNGNKYVRLTVAEALKEITGQDFGTDYEQWMEWWNKNK